MTITSAEDGGHVDIAGANKKVWRPWWKIQMKNCNKLIQDTRLGNYEAVAKLINVDYLKDYAANVNFQENKHGYSALHIAVIENNPKLVNLLVKNFADVRVQDSQLQTPVHLACQSNNFNIFKQLIDSCYQAKESLDIHKKTPLDYAQPNGEIIKYIKRITNMLYNVD